MMEILTFIFQSFWHFLGAAILLGMCLNTILAFYTRTLRYFNIRKHGYPLRHCDADGDLPTED